jgi:hypothetical protein
MQATQTLPAVNSIMQQRFLFSFLDGTVEPTAKQAHRANENGQESQTYSQTGNYKHCYKELLLSSHNLRHILNYSKMIFLINLME